MPFISSPPFSIPIRKPFGEPFGEPFLPAELSPVGEWDSTDSGDFIFSSGAVVSQWNDISGSGNHISQGLVAKQPVRNGGITPSVLFDGTDDFLRRTFVVAQAMPVWFVMGMVVVAANVDDWHFDGIATSNQFVQNADGINDLGMFNNNATIRRSNPNVTTQPYLTVGVFDTAGVFYIDGGTAVGTADFSGAQTWTGLTMAADRQGVGGRPSNIDVAYMAIFPGIPSNANINSIGNYVKNRFPNSSFSWTNV